MSERLRSFSVVVVVSFNPIKGGDPLYSFN
jgi:hypothetical protein